MQAYPNGIHIFENVLGTRSQTSVAQLQRMFDGKKRVFKE